MNLKNKCLLFWNILLRKEGQFCTPLLSDHLSSHSLFSAARIPFPANDSFLQIEWCFKCICFMMWEDSNTANCFRMRTSANWNKNFSFCPSFQLQWLDIQLLQLPFLLQKPVLEVRSELAEISYQKHHRHYACRLVWNISQYCWQVRLNWLKSHEWCFWEVNKFIGSFQGRIIHEYLWWKLEVFPLRYFLGGLTFCCYLSLVLLYSLCLLALLALL